MQQLSFKALDLDYASYEKNQKSIVHKTIGNLKVKCQLGKGNFSAVYLAEDPKGNKFALKVIDLQEISKEPHPKIKQIRQKLADSEPKIMMECKNDHLLKCYDIYQNKDLKILVMEYCSGKTLEAHLQKKKKIPEREAVDILRQVISGIAELHEHKIVHRDLKTENIMEHQGQYKIIDFGFSKQINQEQMKHTLLGTPTTMAPEVKRKQNYGLKADIWSLGIIFFEMVFGVQPYDSRNADKFYNEIELRFKDSEPKTFVGVTLSREAHDFLKKVLKVDSTQRLDWRNMLEHPLIKIKEEEPLPDRFLQRASLILPQVDQRLVNEDLISEEMNLSSNRFSQKEITFQKKQEKGLEQRFNKVQEQRTINNFEKKTKAENQKSPERVTEPYRRRFNQNQLIAEDDQERKKTIQKNIAMEIRRSSKRFNEIRQNEMEQQKNSQQNYERCKKIHLACLKTELIFNEIFTLIESRNILNFEERETIEFAYLLLSRCFLNMSPLKEEIKENPYPHKAFFSLNDQINHLYGQVKERFEVYSQKLTEKENRKKEIVKDFFCKIIWKQYSQQKNIFLGSGIEKKPNKEFGDFQEREQIDYTCVYIDRMLPKMADLGKFTKRIQTYLAAYKKIATVELFELKEESFKEFVQRTIS